MTTDNLEAAQLQSKEGQTKMQVEDVHNGK